MAIPGILMCVAGNTHSIENKHVELIHMMRLFIVLCKQYQFGMSIRDLKSQYVYMYVCTKTQMAYSRSRMYHRDGPYVVGLRYTCFIAVRNPSFQEGKGGESMWKSSFHLTLLQAQFPSSWFKCCVLYNDVMSFFYFLEIHLLIFLGV